MSAAKSKNRSSKAGAPKRDAPRPSLASALAEAVWLEADAALAQALADWEEANTADDAGVRENALALLGQSLQRAARKRGLARVGMLGAIEPYDPDRHELGAPVAKPPKRVRILARGVARGDEVLAKARVGPVGREKKRP
jgi:hypothetical protein